MGWFRPTKLAPLTVRRVTMGAGDDANVDYTYTQSFGVSRPNAVLLCGVLGYGKAQRN